MWVLESDKLTSKSWPSLSPEHWTDYLTSLNLKVPILIWVYKYIPNIHLEDKKSNICKRTATLFTSIIWQAVPGLTPFASLCEVSPSLPLRVTMLLRGSPVAWSGFRVLLYVLLHSCPGVWFWGAFFLPLFESRSKDQINARQFHYLHPALRDPLLFYKLRLDSVHLQLGRACNDPGLLRREILKV